MQYGTDIEANNTSNVTVEDCNITNSSSYGIYNYNSSNFLAQNDTIANGNIYHGILIVGGSNNNCYGNAIYKYQNSNGYHRGAGIQYSASSGYVGGNDIDYYSWGIAGMYGTSLTSYDPYNLGGYNRVADCEFGLMVYQNSYCDFGEYDLNYDARNSVYGNTFYNADVGYAYPSVPAGLYAYGDWWGSNPPNTSLFYVGSACYFYDDGYLNYDPWSSTPLPSGSQSVAGGGTKIADAASRANDPNVQIQGLVAPTSLRDSLLIGIRLRRNNGFTAAKNFFMSFVERHPDNPAGYVELYGCANDSTLSDILNFFKALPAKAPGIEQFLLGNLYQIKKEPDLAVGINNSIIADYPNTPLAVKAETNNMLIDLYDKNDLNGAEALLATIKTQANLITPMELEDAEEAVTLYTGPTPVSGSQKASSPTAISEIPKSFGLAQNYPNPFNPTTLVKYQLPKDTHVTIKVYDILGRVVATLVDGVQSAGTHEVTFNGSKFASGVYFYRLTTPAYSKVMKMLMMK